MKKCKSYQNVAKNLGKKDIYQKFSKKIEIITKNLGLIRPRGKIAYSKGFRLTPPPLAHLCLKYLVYYFRCNECFSAPTRAMNGHKRPFFIKYGGDRASLIDVEKFVNSIVVGNWHWRHWLQF